MILESCQMLCTAANEVGLHNSNLCKPTHKNNSLSIWAREGRINAEWLWEHTLFLEEERCLRFNRKEMHITVARMLKHFPYKQVLSRLPAGGTRFVNCARHKGLGIDFTHESNVCIAYRKYLQARWELQQSAVKCSIASCI